MTLADLGLFLGSGFTLVGQSIPFPKNGVVIALDGVILVGGGWLVLKIRDNGPGMSEESVHLSEDSSGVGLANTRARLLQIYGDSHDFSLCNVDPSGLEVVIRCPLELEDGDEAEVA